MPQPPKVTIAIPTYNRKAYLRQAIQSALDQSYPEVEVIVSDNCSDDGTVEVVAGIQDQRLVCLQQRKNLGMVGNWNACLERATGSFFLLLSDDDHLEKQAIEKLVGVVLESPEPEKVGIAYCRTWEIDPGGARRSIDPIPPLLEEAREFALQYFRRKRKMHPCSTLLRTSDLRRIGGYTQGEVRLAVDAIVWSRILLLRGIVAAAPEALASYRIHPGRTTSTSHFETWVNDMRALSGLWSGEFEKAPPAIQKQFRDAVRDYESWELAGIINQSAGSWRSRVRALGAYWRWRNIFAGAAGKTNALAGIGKLLAPESLKQPVRNLILSWQTVPGRTLEES